MYNDQLRNVERSFMDASGVPRNGYEHMIFAPSISNAYGGSVFPTITDAIFDYQKNKSSKELLEQIKKSLAIVIYSIYSGIYVLKEPLDFSRAWTYFNLYFVKKCFCLNITNTFNTYLLTKSISKMLISLKFMLGKFLNIQCLNYNMF